MTDERPTSPTLDGVVLNASRRFVRILSAEGIVEATASAQTREAIVGDRVRFERRGKDYFIGSLLPRRNELARTYRGETRPLAANLDHLFVVAAVPALIQPLAIDRVLAVAALEHIPCTLAVNKQDLGIGGDAEALVRLYRDAGVPVLVTSAKSGEGMDELRTRLDQPHIHAVALAGVSGVGKSTMLNLLLPEADRPTGEVSARTGQGRQTTTQAAAYRYPRRNAPPLLLIDLPGVQQFGVAHLSREQVASAFPEIAAAAAECKFGDCVHLNESPCAVKAAVAAGKIAPSRYDSYQRMIEEIDEARPY